MSISETNPLQNESKNSDHKSEFDSLHLLDYFLGNSEASEVSTLTASTHSACGHHTGTGTPGHPYPGNVPEVESVGPDENSLKISDSDDDVITDLYEQTPMISDSEVPKMANRIYLSPEIWDECDRLGIQPNELEFPS